MVKYISLPLQEQEKLGELQKMNKNALKRYLNKKIQKKAIQRIEISPILRQQHLICPICLNIMVYPAIIKCGHAFCLSCLQDCFQRSILRKIYPNCSVCRRQIDYYDCSLSSPLKAAIQSYIGSQTNAMKVSNYYNRRQKFQFQERKREAVLQEGAFIDFFDEEIIKWRLGQITHLDIDHNLNSIIKVKVGDHRKTENNFSFSVDSRKIAKYHHYTR